MTKSGEKLRTERLKKGYTLERVELETKIKKSVLEKIEFGNFNSLPPATFVKGFIRNYAIFLSLDPEEVLALYRREIDKPDPVSTTKPFLTQLSNSLFSITPQKIIYLTIFLIIFSFVFYFASQIYSLSSGPSIKIISPSNNEKFTTQNIYLTGKTSSDADLFINTEQISLTAEGEFSKPIILDSGLNKFEISAIDRNGRKNTKIFTVYYNPQ